MFFIVIFLYERIITQKCNLRLLFGDAFAFREFWAAFVENFVEACTSENQVNVMHAWFHLEIELEFIMLIFFTRWES